MKREWFETSDRPIGWAVVGMGMGVWHARYVARSPGLKLGAVCDARPEGIEKRAAEFDGVARYTKIEEVLADDRVSGVSLVLPHDLHAPEAIRCLKAGRHVVLDKPFCLSVAEGRRMIAVARKERRLLSVFHNRRWDADFVAIRRVVDKGAIGKVRYLESRISGLSRMPKGAWRADRRRIGGLLFDWGAHLIDQALLLITSRPVAVYGFAQRDIPEEKGFDVEDRMQAVVRFEDGAVAIVAWATNSPAPMPRFVIEGERGGIRSEAHVHSTSKPKEGAVDLYLPGPKGAIKKQIPLARVDWSEYYRNIGAALRGKAKLAVRPEEALRCVAVAEAAYESARTGRVATLQRALFL
ncbi:MAG: Gfo/Idh/MocA family oxidoreductase [Planctomycetota bacterium]|nr:Gfo/Idh/MocA family oxidoreductase [Planctomycetota bacterium]